MTGVAAANDRLLRWFAPRRTAYPWRADPTPYRVLVSEIMLQQTQAGRVAGAFEAFVRAFPSVRALARAPRASVIRAWAGLGYNARAVRLHEAARAIVARHGGRVPSELEALRALPGVGPYTAAAVLSIAFGSPVPAVDVNVARVVARHRLGAEAHAVTSARVATAAEGWLDRSRPGAWNQALMDLGREHCRPRPLCEPCPIAAGCAFRMSGRAPSPPPGKQAPFRGSRRELRGAIVEALRASSPRSVASLAREAGRPRDAVAGALAGLHRDGIVRCGPQALAGRSGGRVALPEGSASKD